MDPWRQIALELLGSLGAWTPMDPSSRQAALFAQHALEAVRHTTVIRFHIGDAQRRLLTLRLVLRRLLDGVPPHQIDLAEIDVRTVGISAGVYLQGALHSLAYAAGVHAGAATVLFLYGAVRRPNLRRSSPWWEAWRMCHDATAAHVAEAIQRLRHALELFKASVRAVDRAAAYPRMSAGWITSMLAAEQLACYARIEVAAAEGEASKMGLAISVEHGEARSLVAEEDV